MDPLSDPTPAELEMIADTAHQAERGRPMPRKAGEGVADMQARIESLTAGKRKILDQLELATLNPQLSIGLEQTLADINQELREAQERLREYQTQQKGLN